MKPPPVAALLVEDAHHVDDRVGVLHAGAQCLVIEDTRLSHGDVRQDLQLAAPGLVAREGETLVSRLAQHRQQVMTEKAGRAGKKNSHTKFLHAAGRSGGLLSAR